MTTAAFDDDSSELDRRLPRRGSYDDVETLARRDCDLTGDLDVDVISREMGRILWEVTDINGDVARVVEDGDTGLRRVTICDR